MHLESPISITAITVSTTCSNSYNKFRRKVETKIFVKVLGFTFLQFYDIIFFFLSPVQSSPKSQMATLKMKIYYIDAIVIPLSAASEYREKITNSRKKNLFEHKFKNCACFFSLCCSGCVCDPFSISSFHFQFIFVWLKPTSYTRVKLTNFVSCIKFMAAFYLTKIPNAGEKKNTAYKFNITNEQTKGSLDFLLISIFEEKNCSTQFLFL